MATQLQDLQAKRKELQATNPNATMLDAKSALSPASIVNAPVAGQAPAITPIAPVAGQVNTMPKSQQQADIENNIAAGKVVNAIGGDTEQRQTTRDWASKGMSQEEIQAIYNRPNWGKPQNTTPQKAIAIDTTIPGMKNGGGEIMNADGSITPAPVAPAPVAPTPVATVAPVTPTPEVKTPKEPKPTEVAPPPVTIGDMYNNLVNRIDVPPEQKALPTYKIAQNRYNKANMYSTMTPSQLSGEMKGANLVEGSTAWEDLKTMNPKLIQDTINLNHVNGVKPEIFTYVNNPDGTRTKTNKLEETFVSDYNDNYSDIVKILTDIYNPDTAQEARDKIYTPEVRQAEERATEYELKMIAKLDEMAMIDKDVEKEMAGTGATGSRIALEKSYRNEQLQNQYNSLQKTYTAFANKANNLITQNTDLYDKERQNKQALNTALAGIAVKGYEAQQAEKIAKATLNDPTKAIPALIEQYTKLGVPMQRSVQEMIQEAQNEIANGGTLASYLTKLQQTIQSKPEYKRIQAQEVGKGISYQTIGDKVYKNENGVLTLTDISAKSTPTPVWQEWTDSNGVSHAEWITPGVNPTTTTGVKATGNIVPVTAGGKTVRLDQVGASGFENAVNQLTANGTPIVIGQGERDQVATIKSMAERAGIPFNASNPAETAGKLRAKGMQVADPGKSNHESGMAIDVYGSSKLDAVTPEQEKVLNANGWYSAGIPGDAGHFEYKGTAGTQTNGQYSDEQINNLAYLVELQEKNPSEASKQMKEMGYKAQDMANYKAGNMPLTEKQKNSSTEVMDAIKQLADPTKYEWNDAVGFLAGTPSMSGGDAATATMAIDNLVAKLTLPNLGVLKGPMSDKDIAFIKDASSKLSRDQSDASFEKNLIDAYNLSARRAGLPEIKKLSELQGAPQETAGGEKSYSKYEN